ELRRSRGGKHSSADVKLDEYLINLQHKNRALRRLQKKEPRQAELELLEQGFNLYINGAHISTANPPQNRRSIRKCSQPSGDTHTHAQRNTHTADSSRSSTEPFVLDKAKQRSQTAPEKTQRRRWVQESVYICTDKGSEVKVSPEHRYSDDFELYESMDMESPGELEPVDRVLLNADQLKALRRSLEVSVNGGSRDSAGEESEEEWIEEQIEREESNESLPELSLSVQTANQPINKQLHNNDIIMLEFGPSSQSGRKIERSLSAKRKENMESYIPTKTVGRRASGNPCRKEKTHHHSRVERPLSAARKVVEERDSEETALGVFKALQKENTDRHKRHSLGESEREEDGVHDGYGDQYRVQSAMRRIALMEPRQQKCLLKALEKIDADDQTNNMDSSSSSFSPTRNPSLSTSLQQDASQVTPVFYITMEILSNWGHMTQVGLTEVQFFCPQNRKLYVSPHDLDIRNANQPGNLSSLVNGKTKTTKERHMWSCAFHPPVQLYFIIRNVERSPKFIISRMKIWNYNHSLNDLDIGARHIRLYVNSSLVFEGQLEKGCGNQVFDYSNTIHLQEPRFPECTSPISSEPPASDVPKEDTLLDQAESLISPGICAVDMQRDSLERDSPPLDLTATCTQKEQPIRPMITQHSSNRVPHWLQPLKNTGVDEDEAARGRPPWLQYTSDHKSTNSVLPDISYNPIRGSKEGPQRALSREFSSDSLDLDPDLGMEYRMEAKHELSCQTDHESQIDKHLCNRMEQNLDLWDEQLDKIERPISGRRGSARSVNEKRELSRDFSQSEESSPAPVRNRRAKPPWADSEDPLQESWESLTKFNHCQRGRISNMGLEGDIFDEFVQRQSRPTPFAPQGTYSPPLADSDDAEDDTRDPDEDFEIPVLPQGRNLILNILSTWGDRHYLGLNGIEIFSSSGEPVRPVHITADPPDINVLPAYGKDPRVISNLIDGTHRTQDDMHLWLAPFTPGRKHVISMDLGAQFRLAMIRVWNYNKSRIHSFRGAREMEIILDGRCIFPLDQFGDTILFTTDDEILEAMAQFDDTFGSEMQASGTGAEEEELQRPRTADGEGEERPFTQAGFRLEEKPMDLDQVFAGEGCADGREGSSGLYTGSSEYPSFRRFKLHNFLRSSSLQ
ncbi:hypothetical protein DNTS_033846, partial [Danionella cerebrum]